MPRLRRPRRLVATGAGAIRIRPPAHSCDLRIGVDSGISPAPRKRSVAPRADADLPNATAPGIVRSCPVALPADFDLVIQPSRRWQVGRDVRAVVACAAPLHRDASERPARGAAAASASPLPAIATRALRVAAAVCHAVRGAAVIARSCRSTPLTKPVIASTIAVADTASALI